MSKTMLRIVAIVLIVSIVAFSGCLGDKKPAEVEPTPEATPAATPAETPAATPAETPAATPAVEETKTADVGDLFEPSTLKDMPPIEAPAGCDELDQRVLRMYDQDKDGKIDADWMDAASIDIELNRILLSEYNDVKYAYEHDCPVEQVE